ncbi:MAG: hypothetical protein KDA27_23785 [Candidatus Eisenbacteria bacterium]|uniref:Uncharacterized protein n=1 Tax=Eiseniibacteriota bacterium TaxID=2212470 RepID=A0A956NHT4_UNCEI|nr:hypothetical protein [Candidatus Eisenbacteria bacterium]
MAIPFDCSRPNVAAARRIFLAALEEDPDLHEIAAGDPRYEHLVEWVGPRTAGILDFAIHQAFWQLFLEGIVAPGFNAYNEKFPWFHVTDYGKKVLAGSGAPVHDPDGYLARLDSRISTLDPTVRCYLAESLSTFSRGSIVSSAVMLGIAAERVFDLLCESIDSAIASPKEKAKFQGICLRFQMKPKLDFVVAKFQSATVRGLSGFPDNAHIAVLALYDFLRTQRNELGHPQTLPPRLDREEMFANLQVFARYYETVDKIRTALQGSAI